MLFLAFSGSKLFFGQNTEEFPSLDELIYNPVVSHLCPLHLEFSHVCLINVYLPLKPRHIWSFCPHQGEQGDPSVASNKVCSKKEGLGQRNSLGRRHASQEFTGWLLALNCEEYPPLTHYN